MPICILKLDNESPNTELQPCGWLMADNRNDAVRQMQEAGEHDLAEKLRTMMVLIPSKTLLDAKKNIWLLTTKE